jgi:hypothetical protein
MLRAGLKRHTRRRAAVLAACAFAACSLFWAGEANADAPSDLAHVMELIDQQEARLNAQERQLEQQHREIREQRALIERQRAEIAAMNGRVDDADLGEMRGAGLGQSGSTYAALDEPVLLNRRAPLRTLAPPEGGGSPPPTFSATSPAEPVGEAPPETQTATVDALPEGQKALLGAGRLVIEPAIEYAHASSNRLVFRGVEIVTGIQIGLIEANDTARDTVVASMTGRYALTDRLEIEARVPYVYRSDRITTLSQNDAQMTQTFDLEGAEMGDVEASLRYQLNSGRNGAPVLVAGVRVKSDTGRGPFDVARDEQGVSTELATGSGFWAVQGSLSVLYATDPAVLFGNISYMLNVDRDIDRSFGAVTVGNVDPGDSIGFGFGFGFALNPRFSYSLGYSHSYVLETETELNGVNQRSSELQVGTMQLGMSYRTTERLTLATSVEVGVTEDAPDVRMALRTPFRW